MKRVILGILLVLSLSTSVKASDPKTNQITQSVTSGIASAGLGAIAVIYWAECAETFGATCILAAAATVGSVAAGAASVQNFADALEHESDEEGGTEGDRFSSEGLLSERGRIPAGIPLNIITDAELEKIELAKSMMEEAKREGRFSDEMLANPEKFLSAEELAKFNAEKGKIMAQLPEALTEENGDSGENFVAEDSESEGFQTASLAGGISLPSFDSFNLESLLSAKDQGIKNSAPGYYGNVSLKSLRPESKLSLFERVSLRLKKEMKKS